MITRNFKLFLNAGKQIPLMINVSQYDHGEKWVFTLYDDNGQKYTPSTGAIVGIKADKKGIINTGTVNSAGQVEIMETQQMTAAVGKAVFELLIDDQTHGTANFVVLVEPKPGDNADLSESDISMIEEAVEAAANIKPYGSPLVASTVAGMTDETKVYVYTGSETGYTSGHWYYYDGSDWADGGVYNSVAVQTDTTLAISGMAADAKKVGDEISDLKSQISGGGLTADIKQALMNCINYVAWKDNDPNASQYINALQSALYPPIVVTNITLNTNSLSFATLNSTQQLTATTTPTGGEVTWSSSNTSVATVSETGLVTAVGYGNATITATSGSVSATCSVAIAQATVTSISAVYTQSGTVYDTDSLDSLKSDLVVTATWSNQTTSTVASADYTLSGTLTEGTSTITVSYGGESTTFTVTVTEYVPIASVTYTQGSIPSQNSDANRVTGVITNALHFDTETFTITVASGYSVYPFNYSVSNDQSKAGTRSGSNALYVYAVSDSGYIPTSSSSVSGSMKVNGSSLNSAFGWVTDSVAYTFTKTGEYGYSFTGLGFLVKKNDGSNITPAEAESALLFSQTE